mmetsp:Transcript_97054/g.274904  ORF Transcript_97054/g.274904 Transcript_97054/m.274904 type:complete len:351 (-) Transcript_97054:567-1619(-)
MTRFHTCTKMGVFRTVMNLPPTGQWRSASIALVRTVPCRSTSLLLYTSHASQRKIPTLSAACILSKDGSKPAGCISVKQNSEAPLSAGRGVPEPFANLDVVEAVGVDDVDVVVDAVVVVVAVVVLVVVVVVTNVFVVDVVVVVGANSSASRLIALTVAASRSSSVPHMPHCWPPELALHGDAVSVLPLVRGSGASRHTPRLLLISPVMLSCIQRWLSEALAHGRRETFACADFGCSRHTPFAAAISSNVLQLWCHCWLSPDGPLQVHRCSLPAESKHNPLRCLICNVTVTLSGRPDVKLWFLCRFSSACLFRKHLRYVDSLDLSPQDHALHFGSARHVAQQSPAFATSFT